MTPKTQECPRCGRIRLVDPDAVVLTREEAGAIYKALQDGKYCIDAEYVCSEPERERLNAEYEPLLALLTPKESE